MNRPGVQIMHNGIAIELLDRIDTSEEGQLWMVRPLFVDDQEPREVLIKSTDRCSRLHTYTKF